MNNHTSAMEKKLNFYKTKQPFRVSIGKNRWEEYKYFNPRYNLREILNDEIVTEFDMPKDWKGTIQEFRNKISLPAIKETCEKLKAMNISYEVWDHKGKSPHIHIHNLPIQDLNKNQRKIWKECFVKTLVPITYQEYSDFSLCGVHLIAIEFSNHWKGCYSIKLLIDKWEAQQ